MASRRARAARRATGATSETTRTPENASAARSRASSRARVPSHARTPSHPRTPSKWQRIYRVVRRIPRGRVASYGQVARLAGLPRHARLVGYALHALRAEREPGVPWQRVVNARGEVSERADPDAARLQRALLEREGVAFDARGRVDWERHAWRPR